MSVKNFQDLRVWQRAMDLTEAAYSVVKMLPKGEIYELCSQMKRSAVSVPSNIAEGHARNTPKEFVNFLAIARGSCAELQTQMLLCVRLGYLSKDDIKLPLGISYEVSRMLSSLIASLRGNQS